MRDEYKLIMMALLIYVIGIVSFTLIAILSNKWWISLINILILCGVKINVGSDK